MLRNNEILDVLSFGALEKFTQAYSKIDTNYNIFEALFIVLYRKKKGDDYSSELAVFNTMCANF